MAAIPGPSRAPDGEVFRNNLLSTHNVFSAATLAGMERVVWAASETAYGLPFTRTPPPFAPILEDQAVAPESGYALAKVLCEEMARHMHRWNPGTRFVNLRISNIFEAADYAAIPSFQADDEIRKWNLWSWVDARDVAQACRLAIEADVPGFDTLTIAAADTLMDKPSRALMEQHFPNVPLDPALTGNQTLQSIAKARRVLGYEPKHTWRTA
jgi:nucleoside-diphosphate-sugar epimerase